jgi:hypothetical protein
MALENERRALEGGMAALAARLSNDQAKDATALVIAAIKKETDQDRLRILGKWLSALTPRLAGDQAEEMLNLILSGIKSSEDPYGRLELAYGLGPLPTLPARKSQTLRRGLPEPLPAPGGSYRHRSWC